LKKRFWNPGAIPSKFYVPNPNESWPPLLLNESPMKCVMHLLATWQDTRFGWKPKRVRKPNFSFVPWG
jgi:hypothetical protein